MNLSVRKAITLAITPLRMIVGILVGVVVRNRNVWVFGSAGNNFSDNSKHLFIYVTTHCPNIRAVWISGSEQVVAGVISAGGKAYRRWSLAGIYYSVVARYWFVSYYVNDINHWFSRGAVLVNLWHGTPIKKIEFDIKEGALHSLYQSPSIFQRYVFKSHIFRSPDFVITTSEGQTGVYSSAFKIPEERCLPLGSPRLDALGNSKEQAIELATRWGKPSSANLLNRISCFRKTYLYAPTFRDADPAFLANLAIDVASLNRRLMEDESVLLLKLHPSTPEGALGPFRDQSNIMILESSEDLYGILGFCDSLITDYSSIFIDYLVLDRPVVFFAFDYSAYIAKSRSMYYEYREIIPGPLVEDARGFVGLFDAGVEDSYQACRAKVRQFFYSHEGFGNSARITQFFRQHASGHKST